MGMLSSLLPSFFQKQKRKMAAAVSFTVLACNFSDENDLKIKAWRKVMDISGLVYKALQQPQYQTNITIYIYNIT